MKLFSSAKALVFGAGFFFFTFSIFVSFSSLASAGVFSDDEVSVSKESIDPWYKERFAYCKEQVMNSSNLTVHDAIEQKSIIDHPCLGFNSNSELKIDDVAPVAYKTFVGSSGVHLIYKAVVTIQCDTEVTKDSYFILVASDLVKIGDAIPCTYLDAR